VPCASSAPRPAAAIGALALAGMAGRASAAPIDDVLISGPTFDTHFGTNFSAGAAQDPGTLAWNDNGTTQSRCSTAISMPSRRPGSPPRSR
jgi:hypothetical protein